MQRRPLFGAAVIVLASLALAGCVAATPASDSPTASVSSSGDATPSSTPTPVVATALVVSLDDISVTNSDGSTRDSARFSDGAATLALLSGALGSTPAPVRNDQYGFTSYDWGGLSLILSDYDTSALLAMTASELGGLALRTAEGIHAGSTEAQVKAVASPGTEISSEGVGSTYYGLEARTHPGTESLSFPGRVGLDYIGVEAHGGVVVSVRTPSGDWQDV